MWSIKVVDITGPHETSKSTTRNTLQATQYGFDDNDVRLPPRVAMVGLDENERRRRRNAVGEVDEDDGVVAGHDEDDVARMGWNTDKELETLSVYPV